MHTFEQAPAAVAHWLAFVWGRIASQGLTVLIVVVLILLAVFLAHTQEAIIRGYQAARSRRIANQVGKEWGDLAYRIARQRERESSARAQEILDERWPGVQIATMDADQYHAVREQLTAEGLWN